LGGDILYRNRYRASSPFNTTDLENIDRDGFGFDAMEAADEQFLK
jgi:hypothetical protein